jgi:uncharacterized protein (TIRG00374 family)
VGQVTDPEAPHSTAPVRLRRWRRPLVLAVATIVAALVLRGRLPDPRQVVSALKVADLRWLLVAVLAEWVSMAAFARQQMWLLHGLGVPATMGKALAVTYSRSAISISMPAGAAVSAGFAYKAFRRWGASPETAATVMVLSGILSTAGLGLLYLLGFLALIASHPRDSWHAHPVAVATTLAVILLYGVLGGWLVHRYHPSDPRVPAPGGQRVDAVPGRWVGTVRNWLAAVRGAVAVALAMPGRYRRIALAFAVLNWLADLCCLAAVAYALHLPLTFFQLGTVYLAVQIIRQVPVTPGGVGVIEASLLAALVAAGAGQAPAAATVLGYRLFSCWLIIPAGLLAWTLLRDKTPAAPAR